MSLIDEVRGVEERVIARLRELAPAVAEYQELVAVAERLGVADQIPDPSTVAPPAPAGDATEPAVTRRSRPRGRERKSGGPTAAAAKGTAAKPKGTGKGTQQRALTVSSAGPDDALEAKVLAAVAAEPGITVAGMAAQLGVAVNALYRPVRRLTDERRLTKRGRSLHPAE